MPLFPPRRVSIFASIGNLIHKIVFIGIMSGVAIVICLFVPGPAPDKQTIVVAHGTHTGDIAAQLKQQNAVYAAPLFHIAAKLCAGGALKAGEYEIPPHASAVTIARLMHEGKSVVRLFTVAEGLTSFEIVRLLDADPALTGEMPTTPPEGSLLPETYRYDYGDSRASLIARMQKAMQDRLGEIWENRDGTINLQTPRQLVTMASIVEKETAKPEERPRIAGVFYNRLQRSMRLQSDPTVIYAMTAGRNDLGRTLTHEDLAFASPINSYASDGLPPQPICNPGLKALQAAAHPDHHDFLYFVADGTGGHAFAADLATHDANINHWHHVMGNAVKHP